MIFQVVAGETNDTLVVFSYRGAASFGLFKVVEQLRCNKVFVRDPSDGWYNGVLPGLGNDVKSTTASLRKLVSELGTGRLFTVGSSMGGYAALLFGGLLGAKALAFSPQTLLDPIFPLSPTRNQPIEVPDLRTVLGDADVLIGGNDIFDMFHASRVVDQVRAWAVPDCDHDLTTHFNKSGQLTPMIANWMGGRMEIDFPSVVKNEEMEEAVMEFHRHDFARAGARLERLIAHEAESVPLLVLWARSLIKMHRPREAMEALQKVVRLAPTFPEPYLYLAQAWLNLGQPAESMETSSVLLKLSRNFAEGWFIHGASAEGLGRRTEARAAFGRAVEIKPGWAAARERWDALRDETIVATG